MEASRLERFKAFRVVQHFPTLSSIHVKESSSGNTRRRKREAGRVLSPYPPSGTASRHESPRCAKEIRKTMVPWKPAGLKKWGAASNNNSVNAGSSYVEIWKIAQEEKLVKKERFIGGEFYPVGPLPKKGRLTNIFMNAPDPILQNIEIQQLKERSKKNLKNLQDRRREMLQKNTLNFLP